MIVCASDRRTDADYQIRSPRALFAWTSTFDPNLVTNYKFLLINQIIAIDIVFLGVALRIKSSEWSTRGYAYLNMRS